MQSRIKTHALTLFFLTLVTAALLIALWMWTDPPPYVVFLVVIGLLGTLGGLSYNFAITVRSRFYEKTSRIFEGKAKLRKQQESLLRLATSKEIHTGNVASAIFEITECAAFALSAFQTSVWVFNEDQSRLQCLDQYSKDSEQHSAGRVLIKKEHEKYFSEIIKHRVLVGYTADNEEYMRSFFSHFDERQVTALMDAPFYVNGALFGIICIAHAGKKRIWTSDEQIFAGSIADMASIAFEAQKRREIEEELRKKEEEITQMALFSTMNPSPAVKVSKDGRLINSNPAARDILFVDDHKDFPIQSSLPVIEKLGLPSLIARNETLSLTSQIGDEYFHILVRGVADKEIAYIFANNITELRKAEERLSENEAFLRSVIDLVPNLIFVKDREGRFLLANHAVAEVYGTSEAGLIGKTDADFNSNSAEVAHYRKDDLRVLNLKKEIFIPEEKITDSEGKVRYLTTTKKPMVTRDGQVSVLGVATDISERKQLESQLLQSQKMEAVGQLAGGIAHDFNNLLTGILGYATLIKMSTRTPETLHAAELIENASNKAGQLTQKLLGFARKGKHQNIPVNIHTSIYETISLVYRTFEKSISIDQQLQATTPFSKGDPVQIQQIFLNLAINARDAMSKDAGGTDGGRLQITTSTLSNNAVAKRIGQNVEAGNFIEVSFADNGCGIADQNKERIFEPFFTTKTSDRGTGMGLAMVYGIVKNHGGFLSVESQINKGTTFRIYLPCMDNIYSAEGAVKLDEPISGKGKILIVDDHEIIRDVCSKMLNSLGYETILACDGLEAVECYREIHKDVHLVLLDMIMPKMGAKECFIELKKINKHVKVILSTGYGRNNAAQELVDDGVTGFIQKPYQLLHLSKTIAEALKQ